MSDEDKTPRIVVRDRRAFAPDGSRRTDAAPRTEAPAPVVPAAAEPSPAAGAASGPVAPTPGDAPKEDPRFRQLVSLLFSQAAMLLEQEPEPGNQVGDQADQTAGRRSEILQGLQTVIGLLEVLEEKTRGHLAPSDSRLVSQALYQLRVAYMERAKAPGA